MAASSTAWLVNVERAFTRVLLLWYSRILLCVLSGKEEGVKKKKKIRFHRKIPCFVYHSCLCVVAVRLCITLYQRNVSSQWVHYDRGTLCLWEVILQNIPFVSDLNTQGNRPIHATLYACQECLSLTSLCSVYLYH